MFEHSYRQPKERSLTNTLYIFHIFLIYFYYSNHTQKIFAYPARSCENQYIFCHRFLIVIFQIYNVRPYINHLNFEHTLNNLIIVQNIHILMEKKYIKWLSCLKFYRYEEQQLRLLQSSLSMVVVLSKSHNLKVGSHYQQQSTQIQIKILMNLYLTRHLLFFRRTLLANICIRFFMRQNL